MTGIGSRACIVEPRLRCRIRFGTLEVSRTPAGKSSLTLVS
eukprot:COSAG05_NODE_739_length_7625_cov_31.047429_3_plen_41_part_00